MPRPAAARRSIVSVPEGKRGNIMGRVDGKIALVTGAARGLGKAMAGLLGSIQREVSTGKAEVRQVFRIPKIGQIAGCMVTEGTVYRSKPIRVLRDNVVIYEGELESLRRFKDDASEVRNGMECGIGVKNYTDVKVGDQIEVFEVREIARSL